MTPEERKRIAEQKKAAESLNRKLIRKKASKSIEKEVYCSKKVLEELEGKKKRKKA
jgi:hypothetical protein